MPKVDDKQFDVAKVYSQALIDLAESRGEADQILDELEELAGHFERDADFARFLSSPLIDDEERARSLEKMFRGRASDLMVDALQVINRKGRLALLPTIAEAYRLEHQKRLGRIDAHVRTAIALSDSLREQLTEVIRQRYGKEPELIEHVDPSLIGGMVLEIGGEKVDTSVARRIDRLRHALLERSAREILESRQKAVQEAV